jgi:hypothetical protein
MAALKARAIPDVIETLPYAGGRVILWRILVSLAV